MRELISSGSPRESELGYSRAVVTDGFVFVSGSTGSGDPGILLDAAAQYRRALGKIADALATAGSSLADVVSARLYLVREADWDVLAAAHGAVFGDIRPALTMVQVVRLIDPALLVEVEVVARLGASARQP